MEKTMSSSRAKTIAFSVLAALFVVICAFSFAACGDSDMYNVSFNGTTENDVYQLEATTWDRSDEEGYMAVYTLKGEVPYNLEVAQGLGYLDGEGNGMKNFAVIQITSDSVEKVPYDESTGEGFYMGITDEGETTEDLRHDTSFKLVNDEDVDKTSFFLVKGINDTDVKTFTMRISFDGTEEHEQLIKFVIDPKNFSLEKAPATE